MIGLIFVGLVGTFLYFLFDNGFNIAGINFEGREKAAAARQELINAERGAFLFARNCRSCHGNTGEGAIERQGLPGAPLNDDGKRPPTASEAALGPIRNRMSATIHCGRVGTSMPPWSTDEGGPLNDFQIEQIVTLITSGFSLEAWEFAVEEANHGDAFAPHKYLVAAIGEDETTLELNDVSLGDGTSLEVTDDAELQLRIGGETLEDRYEVVTVTAVNADDNTIEVERGVAGSQPMEHEADTEVFNGPIAPSDTITGAEGSTPPCGQRNAPSEEAEAPEEVALEDGMTIEMGDNFFEVDGARNPTFTIAAGEAIEVTLTNSGTAIHNMSHAGEDGELGTDDDVVSDPDVVSGGEEATIELSFDEPGTYAYQCDFHTADMVGKITVE